MQVQHITVVAEAYYMPGEIQEIELPLSLVTLRVDMHLRAEIIMLEAVVSRL